MVEEPSKIEQIKRRLADLDIEKEHLESKLKAIEAEVTAEPNPRETKSRFSNTDKINIFRFLFLGREDVFPVRWENNRSGTSGYAIACGNE